MVHLLSDGPPLAAACKEVAWAWGQAAGDTSHSAKGASRPKLLSAGPHGFLLLLLDFRKFPQIKAAGQNGEPPVTVAFQINNK